MTTVALKQADGTLVDSAGDALEPVRERIRQAQDHRRRNFEGVWQSNLAFAAGKHWLVWDRDMRTLRRIQDVDPRYRGTELYQADVIQEYRGTALGELSSDDDRPELLLQRDDEVSEEFQGQLNRAMSYGWDNEWQADEALEESDALMLDLGTSAIQCYFDQTAGPAAADQVPHQNGEPILDLEKARAYVAQQQADGASANLQTIHQGQGQWRPLSAFNILAPPGVTHERYFPWEGIVRPTLLTSVREVYGAPARDLKEDGDIASILGIEANSQSAGVETYATGESRNSRLRDHVWLFHYFERPTKQYPKGRVLVFGGKTMRLLKQYDRLPYVAPDGSYRSGITYFHWWRVTGRFWSRGLVESLKDGQRAINKLGTQSNEIIDRGMPFTIIGEDSKMKRRAGSPMELVEIGNTERQPVTVPGMGPGPWMQQRIEAIREDIEHATGIRGPRQGENPPGVTTYSQLALLSENERTKRQPIQRARQRSIKRLIEDSVYDMRTYWGPQKQIMLAGDDEEAAAEVFNATKIPTFFIVKVASGAAKPRTQAAELKLIEDVAQYGATTAQPVPLAWFKGSLEAGQALELPENQVDPQIQKAEIENHLMREGFGGAGVDVPVDYFDPPLIHIPRHREAQIQAQLSGDQATFDRVEAHIQQHLLAAQQNAAQVAALSPPPAPEGLVGQSGPPGAAPSAPPSGPPASPQPQGGPA